MVGLDALLLLLLARPAVWCPAPATACTPRSHGWIDRSKRTDKQSVPAARWESVNQSPLQEKQNKTCGLLLHFFGVGSLRRPLAFIRCCLCPFGATDPPRPSFLTSISTALSILFYFGSIDRGREKARIDVLEANEAMGWPWWSCGLDLRLATAHQSVELESAGTR